MSSRQIRIALRWAHIIEGALIAIYIYSPLKNNAVYAGLIEFVIVPLVIASGIAMWQLPRFNKWRSERRRSVVTEQSS
jgi:hypothetical protein